ncbi:MAG: YkgJ family cysteine cluster protein [Fibrobacter sp.]|nr:YkgJ family cysteine cluster protein [Fibrobacter sp.]
MHNDTDNIQKFPVQKELLRIPPEARAVHNGIVRALESMENGNAQSCLADDFKLSYFRVFELFEQYQQMVIQHNNYKVSCKRGCAYCCNHWVEDVNSFEAAIIAEYLRKYFPDSIEKIVAQCIEDEAILNNIEKLTIDRMSDIDDTGTIDYIDLVLSVFYQMNRTCPLLSENGACSIYKVRPLTCRIYMSFSENALCAPEYQETDDIPTYLLNLDENASEILDRLHFRYQRFPEETGLRSMLVKYLTEDT